MAYLINNMKQFLRAISKGQVQLFIVVSVQCLLLLFYCRLSVFNPGQYVFHNSADGFKNYYTLAAFVEDTGSATGLLSFKGFNYPYGEQVFYTDNTPLLSIPLKWINKCGISTHGYTTYLFDLLALLQLVISSILCCLILRRVTDNPIFIILFSITLPVLNPQILRFVPGGTLNLSFSFVILLTAYLMLRLYENLLKERSYIWPLLLVSAFTYLSFLIHVYYLLILAVWVGSFYVLVTGYLVMQKRIFFPFAVSAFTGLIVAVVLFYVTLILTDPFLAERNETALGYNHPSWKLQFSSLFTAYHFIKTKFLVSYTRYIQYEAHVYLGGFALYNLTLLLALKLIGNRSLFANLHEVAGHTNVLFLLLLLAAAFVPFLISLGPEYYFGENNDFVFFNYYSLFYHVELNTKKITHFRCLGRFAWPFFWALNIAVVCLVALLLKSKRWWFTSLVCILLYFNCKDARNAYEFIRSSQVVNPLTLKPEELAGIKDLIKSDYKSNYQAIVPLPYYHVGSESHDFSIDAEKIHFVKTLAFAYNVKLPLMSSTMSRTSLVQARHLYSLVNNDKPSDTLLANLNSKPLLVYVDRSYYADSSLYGNFNLPVQRETFHHSRELTTDYQMKKIAEVGNIELYQLDINSLRSGKQKTPNLLNSNF